jgi:hypothetical protein
MQQMYFTHVSAYGIYEWFDVYLNELFMVQ